MNSKVEDGEDSDMEDMAHMEEKKWETGDSEELIRVQEISKTFHLSAKQRKMEHSASKTKTAVDQVSFCVNRGEVFGLLGPNGAGKTTTLRMLATLIRPDSGDAVLSGSSVVTQPEEVRRKIGFLTSELKLEDFFTPDYLYDFFSGLYGIPTDRRDARKRMLFARFGIQEFAQVRVRDLSTGMKQKVSLVISLVQDPEIIIFDEPTNGLDILTAKVVTDFLLDLKEQGKTIIVSTHIFSLVEKICDRVGIIINGQMTVCENLQTLCGEKSLEDRFFEIYEAVSGEETDHDK